MNLETKRAFYTRPALTSRPQRAIDPKRAARLAALAEAQLAANAPEAAVEVRKTALVLDPTTEGSRRELARALYHAGAFHQALAWLAHLAGSPEAALLRGRVLADLRDTNGAIEAFSAALKSQPDLIEARLRRAAVRLEAGDPVGALPDLDAVLKDNPGSIWARTLRISAGLEAGHASGALRDLAALPEAQRNAYHVLLETRAALLAGQLDSEVDGIFRVGLERHPTDSRLRFAYARHLASRRGLDPAVKVAAQEQLAQVLDPVEPGLPRTTEAEALFLQAELGAEESDSASEAESLYHRGLGLAPDHPSGLCGLGALLLDQGRPAHALPWLIRAAMVDPDRPHTIELLARALPVISDDEAVARWLGLLVSGLPQESPRLLARLLRYIQEAGRADAHEDVRRQAHRMKNKVAVLASRARLDADVASLATRLEDMYDEWARFLGSIRLRPPAPRLLAPTHLVRRALEQAVAEPERVLSHLPAGLPLVRGDEDQLVDALANILTNALQATPPARPVRLSVRTRDASRWVEIAVSDEGPGISPVDRARVFEPGFSTKPDGSGVGLAVARRAILSHGGRIGLASAPGGPTTFTLRLPAAGSASITTMHPFEALAIENLAAT